MSKKIIVAVAPVKNPSLEIPAVCKNPLTPEEITQEVVSCTEAGASMVHLHVRNEKGEQTSDLTHFSKNLDLIRKRSKIIIQGSTGGLSSLSVEERCVCLKDNRVEVASLNMGSVNFGDTVYINTLPEIRYWAKQMKTAGIKPELEIFDVSMISNVLKLFKEELIQEPFHFNFCVGFEGAILATAENLLWLRSLLPQNSIWGVVHDGMKDFSILAAAIGMGASIIRVGFEDSFNITSQKIAKSNVELVRRVVKLVQCIGFEVASCNEARQILNLN
jgi:3-keto-5-aminohexanoate cleavage enzyme